MGFKVFTRCAANGSAKPSQVICLHFTKDLSGAGVHEQMFRSSGQPNAKPPALGSQASVLLIYVATEGMKGSVDFAHPRISALDLWRGSLIHYHSATGLPPLHSTMGN
ncbi:hypothetical protein TNCV_3469281 [Trichonephila clavipes]|nr:hypothetical protein TNCV_3469281 [Trichonephila clavipes]